MTIIKRLRPAISFLLKGTAQIHTSPMICYSSPNNILAGKNIVITGGGKGLGFSMAKKFTEEGANVLIAGRNEDTLKKSSNLIGCHYLTLDVKKVESFHKFIDECSNILNGIDCLVNNAGVSLHENTLFDVTEQTFDAQISTNFKGPYFLTQTYIEYLISTNRKGNVLFISSETGDTMDFRPYGFTKAAINSMVQGLAYLFRKSNIRINAVAPGVTASDMTGLKSDGNLYAGDYATGRFYLPEEVAETACFLLSDLSGCVSGQIITCNNAQTINARWK